MISVLKAIFCLGLKYRSVNQRNCNVYLYIYIYMHYTNHITTCGQWFRLWSSVQWIAITTLSHAHLWTHDLHEGWERRQITTLYNLGLRQHYVCTSHYSKKLYMYSYTLRWHIQWNLSYPNLIYPTLQLSNPTVFAFQLVPMCTYSYGKHKKANSSASINVCVLPVLNI